MNDIYSIIGNENATSTEVQCTTEMYLVTDIPLLNAGPVTGAGDRRTLFQY
jgi:hypothetical protein